MSAAGTLKTLLKGLLNLPALIELGLRQLARGEEAAPPEKAAKTGSEAFSEPEDIRPPKALEREEAYVPVYSLKSPAPVWRRGSVPGGFAARQPEYPALSGGEDGGNREDIAQAVYRRIDFDSRLAPQPMEEA